MDAARDEPIAIGIAPNCARQRRADIRNFGTALDEQARDEQFGAFIARHRDASRDRFGGERGADGRHETVLRLIDFRLGDAACATHRVEPSRRSVGTDGCRSNDGAPRRFELADAGAVERVDRGDCGTIECGVKLAPFACRHDRPGGQAQRLEHLSDADRIDGEHFAEQADRRERRPLFRCCNGASFGLLSRIGEHRTREHILGLGMRRNAETGHVDADDADAVDVLAQQMQRHTARGRHAEIGDDNRVVIGRIGEALDRLLDVFEQFAGDERFGAERHVTDRPFCAVEVRGEGQPVNAACRAREHRRRAPHAQAHAQRAESRTHRLRLVMRALRIVGGVAFEHFGLARLNRCRAQRVPARAAALGKKSRLRQCRKPLRGWAWRCTRRRACRPASRASGCSPRR